MLVGAVSPGLGRPLSYESIKKYKKGKKKRLVLGLSKKGHWCVTQEEARCGQGTKGKSKVGCGKAGQANRDQTMQHLRPCPERYSLSQD